MKGDKATLPWWASQKWCGLGRDGCRTRTGARHVKETGPQAQRVFITWECRGRANVESLPRIEGGLRRILRSVDSDCGGNRGPVGPGGTGEAVRRARAGNSRPLAYTYFHD